MDELSVKILIANREYPVKVNANEEAYVRKAEKLINGKIKEYEEGFSVRDKQDALAMCVLHLAVELIHKKDMKDQCDDSVIENLEEIDKMLSETLSNRIIRD